MFEDSDTIPGGSGGVAPRRTRADLLTLRRAPLRAAAARPSRPDVVHVHQVHAADLALGGARGAASTAFRSSRPSTPIATAAPTGSTCATATSAPTASAPGSACPPCGTAATATPGSRRSRSRSGWTSHRRTWHDGVARYLALTPFMRDMLVSYGLPAERITVRPTWVPDPGSAGEPGPRRALRRAARRGEGDRPPARRLGARASWRPPSPQRLVIAGDGPLRDLVSDGRWTSTRSIRWLGQVPPDGSRRRWRDAAYVVVPSRVFEGYPLAVAEAFGARPPRADRLGWQRRHHRRRPTGWVVDPSAEGLSQALTSITVDDARSRGAHARTSYEQHNTPAAGLPRCSPVYEQPSSLAAGL